MPPMVQVQDITMEDEWARRPAMPGIGFVKASAPDQDKRDKELGLIQATLWTRRSPSHPSGGGLANPISEAWVAIRDDKVLCKVAFREKLKEAYLEAMEEANKANQEASNRAWMLNRSLQPLETTDMLKGKLFLVL